MFIDNTTPLGGTFIQDTYSTGVTELIAPGTNTNGLIIRSLALLNASPDNVAVSVYADTSAPSSISDYTKRIAYNYGVLTTLPDYMLYPLAISPGWGVWVAVGGTDESVDLLMTYDLVSL
jgi:hypothetical protein